MKETIYLSNDLRVEQVAKALKSEGDQPVRIGIFEKDNVTYRVYISERATGKLKVERLKNGAYSDSLNSLQNL